MRRLLPLLLALSACGAPESEAPPDELYASLPQGLVTCTERQDTGYTSGTPFKITVVTCDSKPCELDTANAYAVMQQAAKADGVNLVVVSGFRTQSEQQYLYNCYTSCSCNSCNLAAKPGFSNHQSGHALDLNTASPGVLHWLNNHAGSFGFKRTVPSEDWHWEWWGGGPGGGPCGLTPNKCTTAEDSNCAAFGCGCVDHACSGGFCPGPGCTAKQVSNCAGVGCACVDGTCSGGFCPGTGCTAKETNDCEKFGCGCVDHACRGGACEGSGCTALETTSCADAGLSCALGNCQAEPPDAGTPTDAGEPGDAGTPEDAGTPPPTPAGAELALGTLGCTHAPGPPLAALLLLALGLRRYRPQGT